MSDGGEGSEMRFAGRQLPAWYDDAKFGIFIHWGPYAVPCFAPVDRDMGDLIAAGDWAEIFRWSPYTEWYLNSWSLEGSPTAAHHTATYGSGTYADFVDEFRERSRGVDVGHWADLFAAAGAKYVVPVTKHHDGFLMWRSTTPNPGTSPIVRGPWMAERDHVGELAAATRAAGMRFGLYYSGGIDWTFVPPPIDGFTSMLQNIPNSPEYCEYLLAHVDELVERFEPSVLWNDIAWPFSLDPADTIGRYYDRVPDGVVNDRFNVIAVRSGQLHADFETPEYSTKASERKWEVCRGIGRSFGYNRMETEATMPTVDELIWMLVDIVARGGNLLLNVGPSADGQIPLAQAARLTALGWWLRVNGDAIYGTRPWTLQTGTAGTGQQVRYTAAPDGTAVHAIVQGSVERELCLAGAGRELGAAASGAEVRMLGNDRVLPHAVRGDDLVITLPDHQPAAPATAFSIRLG